MTKLEAEFLTDRGKVRQHNEDAVGVFQNEVGLLAIVADGMGGHLAGDVASGMTIAMFETLWKEAENVETPDAAEKWLKENIKKVNKALHEHALAHPNCSGMGTTFVGVICTSSFATIGHIGDSRCYLYNNDGFKQVTEDHSLVNELVRSGQISKEDAEHHPRKNVLLRALGTEDTVSMDLKTVILEEEDQLLLCSDGLSNKVSDDELGAALKAEASLKQVVTELVELANKNGGEDNISVIIVKKTPAVLNGDGPC